MAPQPDDNINVPPDARLSGHDNFPPPPELRDEIYGYLLRTEHDGATTPACRPAYGIDTTLFQLNRTIRAEALQYLFQHEPLVCLRDNGIPNFDTAMCIYQLPRIENSVQLKEHVALNISLRREVDAESATEQPTATDLPTTTAQERTTYWELILLRDLPILCQVMRHLFNGPPARFILMDTPIGAKAQPRIHNTPYVDLDVVLQASVAGTSYGDLGEKQESAVLESLRKLTSRGISVRCEGFRCAQAASALSQSRARLIWPRAHLWDWLDVMLRGKQQADAQAIQSRDCSARLIFQGIQRYTQSALNSFPESSRDAWGLVVRSFCELVMWDVVISYSQLLVKSADREEATSSIDYMLNTVDAGRLSHATRITIIVVVLDFCLANYLAPDLTDGQRLERRRDVEIWLDVAESHKSQRDPRLMVNVRVAREALSITQWSNPAIYERLRRQRSSQLLPFKVVDSRNEMDKHTSPCEMGGWQDRKHLAMLNFQEQEAIKALQRENGWPESFVS